MDDTSNDVSVGFTSLCVKGTQFYLILAGLQPGGEAYRKRRQFYLILTGLQPGGEAYRKRRQFYLILTGLQPGGEAVDIGPNRFNGFLIELAGETVKTVHDSQDRLTPG